MVNQEMGKFTGLMNMDAGINFIRKGIHLVIDYYPIYSLNDFWNMKRDCRRLEKSLQPGIERKR